MENLIHEIQKLALMKIGSVYPVYQNGDVVYLNRSNSGYAIAIPFNDERTFDETFVGISLSTNILNFNDRSFKVLYLNMNDTGDLQKFSFIGAEFIDVNNRSSLFSNPYVWVDAWKDMFGDSKKKYMITDVLAELIALKYLFHIDKSAKWQGPKEGTHDIVMNARVVEVKSTTHKTNTYVSINSRFQINHSLNEQLFFVRLEPKPYAFSIDSLVEELSMMGYPQDDLENSLKEMGYRTGNRTRKLSFTVLSMVSYEVNEKNFPLLSLETLNKFVISKNIIGYKLTLDLSTAEGETLI